MTTPRKIIIDTDPGQDDAVAILLALASPEDVDVLGITAVAGNVPLRLTERNARIICELARRPDMHVFAGCDAPLQRKLVTAEHVHGKTGLDGPQLADPVMRAATPPCRRLHHRHAARGTGGQRHAVPAWPADQHRDRLPQGPRYRGPRRRRSS